MPERKASISRSALVSFAALVITLISLSLVIFLPKLREYTASLPPDAGAIDRAVTKDTKVIGAEKARKYNITCVASQPDACVLLTRKAEGDEKLREALVYAAVNGVTIRAVRWSNVENKQVDVDAYETAIEIYRFLMGKNPWQ